MVINFILLFMIFALYCCLKIASISDNNKNMD